MKAMLILAALFVMVTLVGCHCEGGICPFHCGCVDENCKCEETGKCVCPAGTCNCKCCS